MPLQVLECQVSRSVDSDTFLRPTAQANLAVLFPDKYGDSADDQVRKTPCRPEVVPTSAFYSCIPAGMCGPTCMFWAGLTPFSLAEHRALRRVARR